MRGYASALALVAALAPMAARAQFNMVPPPLCRAPAPAASTTAETYRVEASRHVYDCFPGRVYPDALPPLVMGIMSVEADIDDKGQLLAVTVVRKPAAEEIEPWILALLRRASPFPAPVKLPGGTVRFVETFFVDRSGLFQTLSLTVSQKALAPVEAASPLATTLP